MDTSKKKTSEKSFEDLLPNPQKENQEDDLVQLTEEAVQQLFLCLADPQQSNNAYSQLYTNFNNFDFIYNQSIITGFIFPLISPERSPDDVGAAFGIFFIYALLDYVWCKFPDNPTYDILFTNPVYELVFPYFTRIHKSIDIFSYLLDIQRKRRVGDSVYDFLVNHDIFHFIHPLILNDDLISINLIDFISCFHHYRRSFSSINSILIDPLCEAVFSKYTNDEEIVYKIFLAFGFFAKKDAELGAHIIQSSYFINTCQNLPDNPPFVFYLLRFLYTALSNTDHYDSTSFCPGEKIHDLISNVKPLILCMLSQLIFNSNDQKIRANALHSLAQLIFDGEMVKSCIMNGIASFIFQLIENESSFEIHKEVIRLLCSLVAAANSESADFLINNNFFDELNFFIEETMPIFPHMIIDALENINHIAETEGKADWAAFIFDDDKIVNVLEKAENMEYNQKNDDYILSVDMHARSLLTRSGNTA